MQWLCDAVEKKLGRKVCDPTGIVGKINGVTDSYGVQCVAGAWLRAYSVYGEQGWAPITGDPWGSGGYIALRAAQLPDQWEVSSTPHAGDLISAKGSPFGGTEPGHIAFVEEVEQGDQYGGWRIRISETNYDSSATKTGTWSGSYNSWNTRYLSKSQLSKQLAKGAKPFIAAKAWKR